MHRTIKTMLNWLMNWVMNWSTLRRCAWPLFWVSFGVCSAYDLTHPASINDQFGALLGLALTLGVALGWAVCRLSRYARYRLSVWQWEHGPEAAALRLCREQKDTAQDDWHRYCLEREEDEYEQAMQAKIEAAGGWE